MKKVLVIGSHSYIGREFQKYVKDSSEMKVSAVSASNGEWEKIRLEDYDIIL